MRKAVIAAYEAGWDARVKDSPECIYMTDELAKYLKTLEGDSSSGPRTAPFHGVNAGSIPASPTII